MLLKNGHSIAAGKNQRVELILFTFQVGNHIIGHQRNTRIGFNLFCRSHRINLVSDPIFKKSLQILEQTESINRINGYRRNTFCNNSIF